MFIPFHDDNPTQRTPVVTYALVAVNVLVFLWMSRLPELQQQVLAYQHGFVPVRVLQLSQPQPIFVPVNVAILDPFWGQRVERRDRTVRPIPGKFRLSLVTCMFLHGSWMHLLGNMWFLRLFGNSVEDRLGPIRYLFLYLVGGLIASGAHWKMDPTSTTPIIGASGAIAAVLGAYAVTWPWAREHLGVFGDLRDHYRRAGAGGARRLVRGASAGGPGVAARGRLGRGGVVGPRRRLLGRHGDDAVVERSGWRREERG